MRKKIVAGNWKMNTTVPEGVALAKEINAALTGRPVNCGVVVCVPATHLCPVADVIDDKLLGLGAENCSEHDKGAYTGEISAAMVASTGAGYPQIVATEALLRYVSYMPSTHIFDSSGKMIAKYAGTLSEAEWINVIETIMAEYS